MELETQDTTTGAALNPPAKELAVTQLEIEENEKVETGETQVSHIRCWGWGNFLRGGCSC